MILNDNFDDNNKEKAIAEIKRLYAKYDNLYDGVEVLHEERLISQRGLSIITDVKYYLRHPKAYIQFENATLQLLKDFSKALA